MAVHEKRHPSVELLAPQSFRLKHDGRLGHHCRRELQCEHPERLLGGRDGMESPKSLLFRIKMGSDALSV